MNNNVKDEKKDFLKYLNNVIKNPNIDNDTIDKIKNNMKCNDITNKNIVNAIKRSNLEEYIEYKKHIMKMLHNENNYFKMDNNLLNLIMKYYNQYTAIMEKNELIKLPNEYVLYKIIELIELIDCEDLTWWFDLDFSKYNNYKKIHLDNIWRKYCMKNNWTFYSSII